MDDETNPVSGYSCWTCKTRRKKCEGTSPVCNTCAALQLTCYRDRDKPEWMDGGVRQEEMVEWFKIKVKENSHRRRAERSVAASSSAGESTTSIGEWILLPQRQVHMSGSNSANQMVSGQVEDTTDSGPGPLPQAHTPSVTPSSSVSQGSDTCLGNTPLRSEEFILITFYLESFFPLLFPFYKPSALQGGKAWILELMLKSPVVRQATLCQSSYCFSLAQETSREDSAWGKVLEQTQDAFRVLGHALQVINSQGITEHIHGAVRIFTSIVQLQRFEIAIMSFGNCRAHLGACVSLFQQLLGVDATEFGCASSCFEAVIDRLGPSPEPLSGSIAPALSAEQAAFRFSSALLIFDDIIASTALQELPQLNDLHRSLLVGEAAIDLKVVVGCENWALLQIADIAALDAWKQQCKRGGNLDIMELVRRAIPIKATIESDLAILQSTSAPCPPKPNNILAALDGTGSLQHQSFVVTSIWAHAALLYLSMVVSGWQPANGEIRYHVNVITDLLIQVSPSPVLRAVCWPLCVAGCLAEPNQEIQIRNLVQDLQPPGIFGALYKALDIMEAVWRNRGSPMAADHDLAACFRSQGELVLLV